VSLYFYDIATVNCVLHFIGTGIFSML